MTREKHTRSRGQRLHRWRLIKKKKKKKKKGRRIILCLHFARVRKTYRARKLRLSENYDGRRRRRRARSNFCKLMVGREFIINEIC